VGKKRIITSNDRVWGIFKSLYQSLFYKKEQKKILMIMGCMRSGTTMLSAVFDKFINTSVFGEFSILSTDDPDKLRLNDIDMINGVLSAQKSDLIIMKPLVESQNANKYLAEIPNSSIIWLYRDFKEVAISNIKKFGVEKGAIANIRPITKDDQSNWRSQNVSKDTQLIIENYFDEGMNPNDAACLFWYVRNILFFEQGLDENSKVTLWKYESFVTDPLEHITDLCQKMDLPDPSNRVIQNVNNFSAPELSDFEVNPELIELCTSLELKLDKVLTNQKDVS